MKKTGIWLLLLVITIVITACGGGGDKGNATVPGTTILVQLKDAGNADYPVNFITISVQKAGGPVLTGVTNTYGIAGIEVTETGTYNVLKADGRDASALALYNDTGREFVKGNPINDPYPNLTYTFTGITVNVTALENDYPVNVSVPDINKVSVLAIGSLVASTGDATLQAGVSDFAGRIMLSNFNINDNYCSIGIWSNDTNGNRLVLYADTTDITSGSFYCDTPFSDTPIGSVAYTQADPVYFEAPGTDSGDWALGCNLSTTDVKTRGGIGGAGSTRNFPIFNGGDTGSDFIIMTTPTSGLGPHIYSFDYRVFKFETF